MFGNLPKGIVSVVQTPFATDGSVDSASVGRLISAAIDDGVHGFLGPVVASEVAFLSRQEREQLIHSVAEAIEECVPFIVGASSDAPEDCQHFARLAKRVKAAAFLVAVPPGLYRQPEKVPGFFQSVTEESDLPLVIQDLEWNGPGLPLSMLARLKELMPNLGGIKIETVPAGPKYTEVQREFGKDLFIAGGWAITQMIEALDRGVDALMPESSMIPVYSQIYRAYMNGDRPKALALFRRLLPVLTFTNQEIGLSIAFFKRLLVRKGLFTTAVMRQPWAGWDEFSLRIADELIELVLQLEKERVT
jgi:4-hydroxy-tetrahydrodipicolinate synthase